MNSVLKFLYLFLMDETGAVGALGDDAGGDDGAGTGDSGDAGTSALADGAGDSGDAGAGDTTTGDAGDSSAGDSSNAIVWPEGVDDSIKDSASLDPFKNKDGSFNVANLLNSYVNTKKMVGMDKVVIPGENASDQEVADFHAKLGWEAEVDKYVLEQKEGSQLEEKFVTDLKAFAHENKVPLSTAKKMVDFMESQADEGSKMNEASIATELKEGLDGLKTEYGKAYDYKLGLAKRVISEVVDVPDIAEALKDPILGSNPVLIRTLVTIGEKLFKEDGFKGSPTESGVVSPTEAEEKINMIMGNLDHPYHKANHPNHDKAQKDMLKLWEMRG